MTPLEIDIMLHYYARADDYRQGDFDAPAVRQAIDIFRGPLNLLEPAEDKSYANYRITERGKVFVQALMNVPLPVQTWAMPASVS